MPLMTSYTGTHRLPSLQSLGPALHTTGPLRDSPVVVECREVAVHRVAEDDDEPQEWRRLSHQLRQRHGEGVAGHGRTPAGEEQDQGARAWLKGFGSAGCRSGVGSIVSSGVTPLDPTDDRKKHCARQGRRRHDGAARLFRACSGVDESRQLLDARPSTANHNWLTGSAMSSPVERDWLWNGCVQRV